jgi:hypothetical protein
MSSTTIDERHGEEAPSAEELGDQVVSILEESSQPIPRGEIIRQLRRRREVAYRVINLLVADGRITVVRGPRNRADLVLAQD